MAKPVNLNENLQLLFRQAYPGEKFNKKEVERRTKVPATTITGFMETGKDPRMSTLMKLAVGFNVELWQLVAPIEILAASRNTGLAELLQFFSSATPKGRETILSVAESAPKHPDPNH